MKSPFPGMDPYLEAHWGDVHTSLITYARDQLHPQLPGDLKVRVEERIAVQDADDEVSSDRYVPDVRVMERPVDGTRERAAAGGIAAAEPILVPRLREPTTERSLQIIDSRSGRRIVTTIEVLSLANKVDGAGRAAYRKKQRQLEMGGVNLVEIDLLREGGYVLTAPLSTVPPSCRGPYRISVSRATNVDAVEMYPVALQERLPTIRIPLRATDMDVVLDVQALIAAAYENGGYDDTDYSVEPVPELSSPDAEWADSLLREAKRR